MMNRKFKVTILAAIFSINSICLAASNTPKIISPDQIQWKELPGHNEIQYAVLAGNPLKNGPFTARLKFPKDYSDIIHSHEQTRYNTVISGAYYVGFGDKIDRDKVQESTAGSFIACPAHINHYGFTRDETVIQIAGNGPWEVLKSSGKNR